MKRNAISEHYILSPTKSSVVLPKINNKLEANKQKNMLKLFQQIKPYNKQSRESSDTSALMRKISTPVKSTPKLQIVVLNKNKNKKQYLQKQYIKQSLIGEQAIQVFYERYKKIDKAKAMQNFLLQDHPITKIVDLLQCHNFTPRKLDILKLKGSQQILDLRKFGLGQGTLGPLIAELLDYVGKFQSVDLSYNRIDRNLSEILIQKVSKVNKLNLSHNRVGKVACTMFAEIFLCDTTLITNLNLKDNSLLDNAGVYVVENLLTYDRLQVLNMSKNCLGPKFAAKLRQFLRKDDVLDQLYISWNQFGEKGTQLIFEGIQVNQNLKVFDFSWNTISYLNSPIVSKGILILYSALKFNQSILHLDLSFCDIDRKSTKVIADGLLENHTIYGLHYQGNSGTVDSRGYLTPMEKQFFQYPLPIVKGMIREMDGMKPNPVSNQFKDSNVRDVCWICQCWQQVRLKIEKNSYDDVECFLHSQDENYKGIKMKDDNKYFQVYRMCPVGKNIFFFTLRNRKGIKSHTVCKDFKVFDNKTQLQYTIGTENVKDIIQSINILEVDYNIQPISEDYNINIKALPRTIEVKVSYTQIRQTQFKQKNNKKTLKKKKKVIVEEKLNIKFRDTDQMADPDFINDYNNRDEDKAFLKQCIEFDIVNSKILRILKKKQDVETLKRIMVNYYVDFKDTYYYLANNNPNNQNIFFISQFQFQKFLDEQKYITKRVTHAKVMVKLYSCLSAAEDQSNVKKSQLNKLFVRPQFLQFIIRLALQKWCAFIPKAKPKEQKQKKQIQQKNNQQKQDKQDQDQQNKKLKLKLPLTFEEGFEKTIKTISKFAARVRSSNWRKKKYLTIQTYTVIKGYQGILMAIYEKYTKIKVGRPKKLQGLLILDDFKNIFIDTDIKRNREAMKQSQVCFLDSKRLQIQDGIIQYGLTYDQFVQCFARYSQQLWFPPVADENNPLWNAEIFRKLCPLFIKLQSLIINVYRRIPEMQNQKFNKITENGLFKQEIEVLPDVIQQISLQTSSNFAFKVNTLESNQVQQITFKRLVQNLKEKYKDAVVKKEQIQHFQQIQTQK